MYASVSPGEVSARVYRSVDALEELRGFWESRATLSAGNLDFYLSHICARPEVVRPHVVVLFRDDKPQLLLLGRLEKRNIPFRIGHLRIASPQLNILVFDDGGWLNDVPMRESKLFVGNILESLRSGEADVAILSHLDTGYPLYELARTSPGRLWSDHMPAIESHWVRQLTRDKPFIQTFSGKSRSTLKRKARRLSELFDGEVRFESFRDPAQIDRMIRDAETVARKSYQRGLGVGFTNDELMRGRLDLVARLGMLRAHVLYLRNEPCAFWIMTMCGGVLLSDFLAFDPAYAKYSPGMQLMVNAIEEIESEKLFPMIDFGFGDAEYKAQFGENERHCASLFIFSPGVKGAGLNLIKTATQFADRYLRRSLQSIGVLRFLKRLLRRRATQRQ